MNLKPSNNLIKQALQAHSSLGLFISFLLYLVCLTGTLTVFFEEFERWEQPNIEEYSHYSVEQIEQAVDNFLARSDQTPETLYVVLPTDAVPRMHIGDENNEWFINKDGSLSEPPLEAWTAMLKQLHIQLHLPQTIGMIIVGIIGVLLCSLIFSGILAHAKIVKDAFKLRTGGSHYIQQADLHNRLSVWGLPFYLMIAITGAFIGLSSLFSASSAYVYFENDTQAVIETIYGGDPVISTPLQANNYKAAFAQLAMQAPTAQPIYLALHQLQTPQQYFEIAATLPERLIYSEIYRFKSSGELINHQGFSDGSAGRQIAYSVYRLHFGHFDSFIVKILYGILGLALTVISATGINIWLSKRKYRNSVNDLWVATVWGTPLALAFSATMSLAGYSPLTAFIVVILFSISLSLWIKNEVTTRRILLSLIALSLISISITHIIQFTLHHGNDVGNTVNALLIIVAISIYAYLKTSKSD